MHLRNRSVGPDGWYAGERRSPFRSPILRRDVLGRVGSCLRLHPFSKSKHTDISLMRRERGIGMALAQFSFLSMSDPQPGDNTLTGGPFEADASPRVEHAVSPFNRRREARVEDRHWYTYEMYESHSTGAEAVVEGKVLSLNRSAHGILLLMSESPRVRQLVALYNPRLGWYRSTMVYEICWVRALSIESETSQFLVGCRHVMAASR